MPAAQEHPIHIQDLSALRRGDTVEARHYDTVHYRGEIDAVVPHLGVLWLRHGPWQDRTLLEVTEYALWKVPSARTRVGILVAEASFRADLQDVTPDIAPLETVPAGTAAAGGAEENR